jgi:hypothetical protein
MDCFINLCLGRADAGDEDGFGVPAERVFEEPGELAVSVGHVAVRALVAELVDHLAQREQRLVDVAALGEPQPCVTRVYLCSA